MNNIVLWSELKEDVVHAAAALVDVIRTESDRLAKECGQRPNDRVRIVVGDAIIEVNGDCVKLLDTTYSKDDVKRAAAHHWSGRRSDWMVIYVALHGLVSSWKIREVLVSRL